MASWKCKRKGQKVTRITVNICNKLLFTWLLAVKDIFYMDEQQTDKGFLSLDCLVGKNIKKALPQIWGEQSDQSCSSD